MKQIKLINMAKNIIGPDLEKYYSKARALLSLKLPRAFMLVT